jgi:ribosomal protein S18 acetylase RimI-like enzyme
LAAAPDLVAVRACVQAAYAHYVPRIGQQPAPMGADYAVLIERRVVWVLLGPESAVRGVLVMLPEDDAMFIENVAVHPDHQQQGLGRRLLEFAEQQALATGLSALTLYTNEQMVENIAMYRHLGFEETERKLDHGFNRVFMRKSLAYLSSTGNATCSI